MIYNVELLILPKLDNVAPKTQPKLPLKFKSPVHVNEVLIINNEPYLITLITHYPTGIDTKEQSKRSTIQIVNQQELNAYQRRNQ